MNALDLLKEDHQKVSELLDRMEGLEEVGDIKRLFRRIRQELDTHAFIEETVFYPTVANFNELKDTIDRSFEEHQELKDLLQEISQTSDPEILDDRIEELTEVIESHVRQEESELFPKVRSLMDAQQLEEMGDRLEAARTSAPGIRAVA